MEEDREKIDDLLQEIKAQYQFQNDRELIHLLEGLAHKESKGVTYWDYIEVDTLLSLQKTRTNFPDEVVFIAYHQIHELYFKLIIQELEKITRPKKKKWQNFLEKDEVIRWNKGLKRVTRYMNKLIGSFDVMKFNLDRGEFGIFRKSLLPASGFQTHQFRLIEIMLTHFENLIRDEDRRKIEGELDLSVHFNAIYWRTGAIERDTLREAKILVNFNNKYDSLFKKELRMFERRNIYSRYMAATPDFQAAVKNAMMEVEQSILMWKIAHFKTIQAHIPKGKPGTGGTKWEEYLPLQNQKAFYFPQFWNPETLGADIAKMEKEYPERMMAELREILGED